MERDPRVALHLADLEDVPRVLDAVRGRVVSITPTAPLSTSSGWRRITSADPTPGRWPGPGARDPDDRGSDKIHAIDR